MGEFMRKGFVCLLPLVSAFFLCHCATKIALKEAATGVQLVKSVPGDCEALGKVEWQDPVLGATPVSSVENGLKNAALAMGANTVQVHAVNPGETLSVRARGRGIAYLCQGNN